MSQLPFLHDCSRRGLTAAAFLFFAAGSLQAKAAAVCPGFAAWQQQGTDGVPRWSRDSAGAAQIADAGAEVFDAALVSPVFAIPAQGLRLHWRQQLQLSWANTAGVLEIAIDRGAWTDFSAAGGRFLSGGYYGRAFAGNPLGARAAWAGEDRMLETRAELPAAARPRSVQLRLRLGSGGTGDTRPGWQVSGLGCE